MVLRGSTKDQVVYWSTKRMGRWIGRKKPSDQGRVGGILSLLSQA